MNANIETEITHFALFNLFNLFKILSAHSSHQQSSFNEKNQLRGKSREAYKDFWAICHKKVRNAFNKYFVGLLNRKKSQATIKEAQIYIILKKLFDNVFSWTLFN